MRNSVAKPSISLFRGNLPQLFFSATSSFLQRSLQTNYYFYYKLTSVHSLHCAHSFTHARQTHTHTPYIQNNPTIIGTFAKVPLIAIICRQSLNLSRCHLHSFPCDVYVLNARTLHAFELSDVNSLVLKSLNSSLWKYLKGLLGNETVAKPYRTSNYRLS